MFLEEPVLVYKEKTELDVYISKSGHLAILVSASGTTPTRLFKPGGSLDDVPVHAQGYLQSIEPEISDIYRASVLNWEAGLLEDILLSHCEAVGVTNLFKPRSTHWEVSDWTPVLRKDSKAAQKKKAKNQGQKVKWKQEIEKLESTLGTEAVGANAEVIGQSREAGEDPAPSAPNPLERPSGDVSQARGISIDSIDEQKEESTKGKHYFLAAMEKDNNEMAYWRPRMGSCPQGRCNDQGHL